MAGIKQHYIPQLLQRGFEASKSGKHSQVWVFRKGQAPYKSSTEGVGAQRHFYSDPSTDDDALDNIITRYEQVVLTPAVNGLRSAPVGAVESDLAASVVSHLTVRAAFMRGSFGEMAKKFLARMSQEMSCAESARAFMGVDSVSEESILDKVVAENLSEDAAMLPEVARQRIGRMVKFRFREHFGSDFKSMSGMLGKYMEIFAHAFPRAIEDGHIRALEKELVPQKRTEKLKAFHWKLIQVPEGSHVVLPDCLALANDHADRSQLKPYTLADDDTLACVLMPVSSSRLLLGSQADFAVNWATLNSVLARSALDFFISSRNDEDTVESAQQIGLAVSEHSRKLVEEDAFSAPVRTPEPKDLTAAGRVPLVPVVEFWPKSLKTKTLEAAMRKQLRAPELAPYLGCLRALVVTTDVPNALARRGVTLNDYGKQQAQFGTCQGNFTPQGFVCEVFVPLGLAQMILNPLQEQARSAAVLVRHHLGRAAYLNFFAKSVTPQEVQEPRGQLESSLLAMAQLAASHYFGARLSSPKTMGEQEFRMSDELQVRALRWSLQGLASARAQFATEPNVDKLLFTLGVLTESLLATAAPAGVLRQLNPQLWDAGECAKVLSDAGLLNWFLLLCRDMDAYFDTRDTWQGLAELAFLATHAERILWGYGFYLSPAGSQVRVDVGNDQEIAIVTKLLSGVNLVVPSP